MDASRAIKSLLSAFILDQGGFRVLTAASLAETRHCLDQGPAERFFCAVVDINLPDAPDGEIVDLVRERNVPVVVLTNALDESLRQRLVQKQVVDYVIKRSTAEIEYVAAIVAQLRDNLSIKVLIVDDSAVFRQYLDALLRNLRYQTLSAVNGKDALRVLEEHPDINLVITDINMPVMTGLELIEEIRLTRNRGELGIIGLSDAAKPGLSALMLKTGANDFIFKPFEIEEFYCRVNQNTSLVSYIRRVREAATRDFLTSLFNRRHLFELGEALYANAQRGNILLAAALVDVDHFKRINDRHGHQTGDLALKTLADVLRATLRTTDILGRYGGEEFVCLALLKDLREAPIVFERVRSAVEQIQLEVNGEQIRLTVSIGVTTDLRHSLDAMLKLADTAMYQAKQGGRNRVVHIAEDPDAIMEPPGLPTSSR